MDNLINNYLQPQLHPANLSISAAIGLFQPAMHAVSSLLLLGACAFQTVFGRPEDSRTKRDAQILKRSVDGFIEWETPIAWRKLLCNIGATGCTAAGAASGVVVASPSKRDPDCESLVKRSRMSAKANS